MHRPQTTNSAGRNLRKSFGGKIRSTGRRLQDAGRLLRAGSSVRAYARHLGALRRRYAVADADGIVLVSFCSDPAVLHTYAELVPRLAAKLRASVGCFDFTARPPLPEYSALYRTLGWSAVLTLAPDPELCRRVEKRAAQIFESLKSKSCVAAIKEKDVLLGDLVYDTYLRDLCQATVDIKDPRLRDYIRDALLMLELSESYFSRNRVKAVFADHLVYIWQGVLLRLAMKREIPLHTVYFNPRPSAQRIDVLARAEGMEMPSRYSYWIYPEVFRRLPAEQQAAAREKGRRFLNERIGGVLHDGVLPGQTAYGHGSKVRVLSTTDRPKVLVLLHDFCDAVHVFRDLLFDDFFEWIHFLLKEAGQTPYEWYVKPHPNMNDYRRRGIDNANQKVVADLKLRYPEVRFLDPATSNRQLAEEGLSAVFTMYGTAAHEMPFLGVPSVCGADNPHAAYGFAFTPKTREDYISLIKAAGHLAKPESAEEICEFAYMYYLYQSEHLGADTRIFEPMPGAARGRDEVLNSALRAVSDRQQGELDRYVDDLFAGRAQSCVA